MGQALLILHFVGLMMGAGGGYAAGLVGGRALSLPPDQAARLRELGRKAAIYSSIGLLLLWVTGFALVWQKWSGFGNLPNLFWVKLGFVVLLTLAIGGIHAMNARIRRGDKAAASRQPVLGNLAMLSTLGAVVFAVIAFYD